MRGLVSRLRSTFSSFCTAKRGTARRLILALAGVCLISMIAPASGQWLGRKILSNSESGAGGANRKLTATITKLTTDARAAAERGDLETARTLSQRAYKLSLASQSILAGHPTCSPSAMEALVWQYEAAGSSSSVQQIAKQPAVPRAIVATPEPQEIISEHTVSPEEGPTERPAPQRVALRAVAVDPLTVLRSNESPAVPAVKATVRKASVQTAPIPYVAARESSAEQKPPACITPLRLPAGLWPTPQPTDGYLALQTKWLSPTVDSQTLIDELPSAPREPFPSQRTLATLRGIPVSQYIQLEPSSYTGDAPPAPIDAENADFLSEPTGTSSVTTALGESEDDAEPEDAEDDGEELWEPPQQPRRNSPPVEVRPSFRQNRATAAPALDDEATGPADAETASRVSNAVLTTNDRDEERGQTRQASGEFDVTLTPETIDTMFPSSTEPNPFCQPRESEPLLPELKTLGICVRDNDATDWETSAEPAEMKEASVGLPWNLSERAAAHPAIVSSLLLVLGGLVLFGLSFRREPA